ncbi:hypothetical protein M405DRAFT_821032 [Rhizopogon salebrosus TDB-379]|nr:hypothetical protein M405DRAFT_821032 [Rhizopogon salebrosus TDB-379]
MDNLHKSNRFSVSFPSSLFSTATKHLHPDAFLFIVHSSPLCIAKSYRRADDFLTLLHASVCRPRCTSGIALVWYPVRSNRFT